MKYKKSVLVGMSGGVDSTVASFLLKEKGFRVEGIFFQFFNEDDSLEIKRDNVLNSGFSSTSRVRMIAEKLDIPFYKIDYQKEFREIVIDDFIRQYQGGMTPNPCIICNEKVKFNLLLSYALKNNIEYIATGHYAQVEKDWDQKQFFLKRGLDTKKDQSYFLYRLDQNILSKSLFPLGRLTKKGVEKIALEIGLETHRIKESQEICFINEGNYQKFIENNRREENKPGYFLDTSGNKLGKHKGIAFYTIGQRKKIGLSSNTRKYIIRINVEDNTIIIGNETDLYQRAFKIEKVHFISIDPISRPIKLQVQIRYNTHPAYAKVFPDQENRLNVFFDKPQKAITPGQSAVFYKKDNVIGGGIISNL